jgi:thiamine biosynthesis lipoprotein
MMRKVPDRRDFIKILAFGGATGVALKLGLGTFSSSDAYSETRLLMGTVVNLTIVGTNQREASQAISACLDSMARLEGVLSQFRPDSQLARLNRDGELVGADSSLLKLLSLSNQLYQQTGGAFDISVKPLLDLYNKAQAQDRGLPTEADIKTVLRLVDASQIQIEAEYIQFGKAGMAISLDGIAKGYIVDQGIDELKRLGYGNILVEAGGDLSAGGERVQGQPWRVGLQAPREDLAHLMAKLEVRDQSVATSGDYMQAFTEDFQHHHILDPRTGISSPELASATIVTASGALADGLATAAMVMGLDESLALIEKLEGIEAYLVTKTMREYKTSGLRTIG